RQLHGEAGHPPGSEHVGDQREHEEEHDEPQQAPGHAERRGECSQHLWFTELTLERTPAKTLLAASSVALAGWLRPCGAIDGAVIAEGRVSPLGASPPFPP